MSNTGLVIDCHDTKRSHHLEDEVLFFGVLLRTAQAGNAFAAVHGKGLALNFFGFDETSITGFLGFAGNFLNCLLPRNGFPFL